MTARLLRSCLLLTLMCASIAPASANDDTSRSKARARRRVQAPQIASVVSATHPHITQTALAAGSVLRIAGLGFGDATDTHAILKTAGVEAGVTLTIVSWQDGEILVQLPSVAELGFDAATADALAKEVSATRPLVSMGASIALLRGSSALAEPIALRIAVAAYDFDGDGVDRAHDANDLDPGAH